MADMHILTGDNGDRWSIVMHIAVPAGDNAVGVSWADALIASGRGGTTSLPDGDGSNGTIDATEKAAIEAGTVYEHSGSFLVESGGTSNAELQAAIRKFYATDEAEQVNRLKSALRYFGHTESKEPS